MSKRYKYVMLVKTERGWKEIEGYAVADRPSRALKLLEAKNPLVCAAYSERKAHCIGQDPSSYGGTRKAEACAA